MAITDLAVLIFAFAFAAQGWRQGIVRALIGPASLLLSAMLAVTCYWKTGSLIAGFAIVFFGPLILGLVLSLSLSWWHAVFTKEKSVSELSRALGGFFSLVWSGAFLLTVLFLLMLLPTTRLPFLTAMQSDIRSSRSYGLVKSIARRQALPLPSFEENLRVLSDPERLEDLQSTDEFKDLEEDPKIQTLLSDEEILNQIEEKNLAALLSNPKVTAVLQDEKLMKKFLELNRKIAETADEENAAR